MKEKEIDCALSCRRRVIPLNIDGSHLNDAFKLYLNNVQMIFYSENPEKAIGELKTLLSPLSCPAPKEAQSHIDNTPKKEAPVAIAEHNAPSRRDSHLAFPVYQRGMDISEVDDLNRIPIRCRYCGSAVSKSPIEGIYRCVACGEENYDDFYSIRKYIRDNGARTVYEISSALNIPMKIVQHWRDLQNSKNL